jgi:hypothetical protein
VRTVPQEEVERTVERLFRGELGEIDFRSEAFLSQKREVVLAIR